MIVLKFDRTCLGARMTTKAAVMHERTGPEVHEIENRPIAVPFRKIAPAPLTPNPLSLPALTITNGGVANSRRDFLLTVAGGIAGLAVASSPARGLAPPAGGAPPRVSTIGA